MNTTAELARLRTSLPVPKQRPFTRSARWPVDAPYHNEDDNIQVLVQLAMMQASPEVVMGYCKRLLREWENRYQPSHPTTPEKTRRQFLFRTHNAGQRTQIAYAKEETTE
jgi:hypothetical protein